MNRKEEMEASEYDPPMKWLIERLRGLATELVADPKTTWIGERDPKQHICWTAADRLDELESRALHAETVLAEQDLAALRASAAPEEGQIWLLAGRLAGAELNYRNAYEQLGGSHMETGRAWDKLRQAGNAIREISDSVWESALPSDSGLAAPDAWRENEIANVLSEFFPAKQWYYDLAAKAIVQRAALAPATEGGEKITFSRWWIEKARDQMIAMKLPSGYVGDWIFLFREQLSDALNLSPSPSVGTGTQPISSADRAGEA